MRQPILHFTLAPAALVLSALAPSCPAQAPLLYLEGITGDYKDRSLGNGLAVGDVDGDGDLDIVQGWGGLSNAFAIFLNTQSGVFVEKHVPAHGLTLFSGYGPIKLVDLDFDGDLDIVATNSAAWSSRATLSGIELWENDGKGGFRYGKGTKFKIPIVHGTFAIGDVDRDRDPDIVVGRLGGLSGDTNLLLLNNGVGAFAQSNALSTKKTQTTGVSLADFNRDGVLDFLFCNQSQPQELWVSTPGGKYILKAYLPATDPFLGLFVDIDGDHVPEIILNDFWQKIVTVYSVDRNGGFKVLKTFPSDGQTPPRAVDYDHDGDLDLLIGAIGGGVYRNDGKLQFTKVTQSNLLYGLSGDLDGDGDTDFVSFVVQPKRRLAIQVLRNHLRHLAAPSNTRIGTSLKVELTANHNHAMPLGISLKQARIPMGLWGDLRLDPSAMLLLPPKTIQNRIRASWNFPVPNDNSLVGLDLKFQALDVPPAGGVPHFTSQKSTTLVR